MVDPGLFLRLAGAARNACARRGPAHDFAHVERVVRNARAISRTERCDRAVVTLAALLHELASYPKSDPRSSSSGQLCAVAALRLLRRERVGLQRARAVAECIRDHPFSLGVVPARIEARILQDADRLDAIGAVGIARCFATCAEMRRPLFAPRDPLCRARAPDDKAWGLDHFFTKLLRVPESLHTAAARELARARVRCMRRYLAALEHELAGEAAGGRLR
jgi:uncharacterized protein